MKIFKNKKAFTLIELPAARNHVINPEQRRRAFTLIELLVVIAIIGILATIIVVSYINAAAKSRDNKRRADIQEIASAHQLMHQDTKLWYILGTGHDNGTGGKGRGWFNLHIYSYSAESIAHGLEINKFIDVAPRDPKMKDDNDQTISTTGPCESDNSCYHYMVYDCDGGVRIMARLEFPTPDEVANAQINTPTCVYPVGYARNYSILVK